MTKFKGVTRGSLNLPINITVLVPFLSWEVINGAECCSDQSVKQNFLFQLVMFLTHYLKLFIILLEIMDAFSLDMNLTLRTNTKMIPFRYAILDNVRVHNPVLKDYSELLQWIKKDIKRTRHKRQSGSWDCNGLCKRSLCSWTEVLDYDGKRSPASVPKAVCNNPKCNFNFTGSNLPMRYNMLSACEPLTTGKFIHC